MAKGSIKKTIAAMTDGKKFPALTLAREKPELAATVSKLVMGQRPSVYDQRGNRDIPAPDVAVFKGLSTKKEQDNIDTETTMQMLPDVRVAFQILISSIISPKDLTTTEINYATTEGLLPSEVSSSMISELRKYFENDYKIKDLLPVMLEDMLCNTGCYPVAVIPENALDEVINGNRTISTESMSDLLTPDGHLVSREILGPVMGPSPTERTTLRYSLESFAPRTVATGDLDQEIGLQASFGGKKVETGLTVTDNMGVMKLPLLRQRMTNERIRQVSTGYSTESAHGNSTSVAGFANRLNDRELTAATFKNRQFRHRPIVSLKTQNQLNRYTVGEPLILHLSSHSVIPVHVPGRVDQQVGFFILLDAEGYPLSASDSPDDYSKLQARLNSTSSFSSSMLEKVKTQMAGFDYTMPGAFDYASLAYGDFIERDLLARLRNGAYDNGVALAKNTEVYRIMFARSLAQQNTQLLFMPAEFCTYMAFNYDNNGIGKSLLDDGRVLNSMRIMAQLADTMAAVRNSIGRTSVQVKLDPDDPDPNKTRENIIHEIARSRVSSYPLGANTISEMVDGIMQAGIEIHVTGHPGMPDMDIDFTEKNTNFTKVDPALQEDLRKQSVMLTGVTPEMVDSSFQPEFATIFAENNIMMAKRAITWQDKFLPQIADNIKKVTVNSGNLFGKLAKILDSHFDVVKNFIKSKEEVFLKGWIDLEGIDVREYNDKLEKGEQIVIPDAILDKNRTRIIDAILDEFIDGLTVILPRPSSVTLEKQMEAFDKYSESIEKAINAFLDNNAFTDQIAGDSSSQLDGLKAAIKGYYLRNFMTDNGIMPEMSKLTTRDMDGKLASEVLKGITSHNDNTLEFVVEMLKDTKKGREKATKELDKLGVDAPSTTGDGFSDTSSSDTASALGGDDFSDTDFMDNDSAPPGEPGAETSSTTETETETTETNTEETPAAPAGSETPPVEPPAV